MAEQSRPVLKALQSIYTIKKEYYWTDSAIVYAWILNGKKKHDRYTNTRLEKIRTIITNKDMLKLIPSKLNPADIGTRGLSPKDLSESKLWYLGPEMLMLPEKSWPNLQIGDKFGDYDGKNSTSSASTNDIKAVNIEISVTNPVNNVISGKLETLSKIIDVNRFR